MPGCIQLSPDALDVQSQPKTELAPSSQALPAPLLAAPILLLPPVPWVDQAPQSRRVSPRAGGRPPAAAPPPRTTMYFPHVFIFSAYDTCKI